MITSCAISPFNGIARAPSLANVRVAGGVSVRTEDRNGSSTVTHLHENDGYRALLVRRSDPPEMIIVNTGGGLASGDRVHQRFEVGDRSALTVTTQAAERSYRSGDGATACVDVEASVGSNATLNWLPQETILFDNARLARSIDVELSSTSRLLMAETVVFGRRAMGESLASGLFADRWRIRRDGKLIFAENIKLNDAAYAMMPCPVMSHGAHAALTLLLTAPGVEDLLARTRTVLDWMTFECAASAWDGKLVVRGLAQKPEDIRRLMQLLIPALGGSTLPRTWST